MTEFKIPEQIDDFKKFYKKNKTPIVQVNITTGVRAMLGNVKQKYEKLAEVLTSKQQINFKLEYDESLSPDEIIIKVTV